MQISKLRWGPLLGHSFALNYLPRIRLYNLFWVALDVDPPPIKVLNRLFEPEQRFLKCYREGDKQVVAYPFKSIVGALSDGEDEVALRKVWHLLGFALEDDRIACGHTFLDVEC